MPQGRLSSRQSFKASQFSRHLAARGESFRCDDIFLKQGARFAVRGGWRSDLPKAEETPELIDWTWKCCEMLRGPGSMNLSGMAL